MKTLSIKPLKCRKTSLIFVGRQFGEQSETFLEDCHSVHKESPYAVFKDSSVRDRWKKRIGPLYHQRNLSGNRGDEIIEVFSLRLGIMQPYFFPYIGYFDLINCTDRWIVFCLPCSTYGTVGSIAIAFSILDQERHHDHIRLHDGGWYGRGKFGKRIGGEHWPLFPPIKF